jgi:hypothetical protein
LSLQYPFINEESETVQNCPLKYFSQIAELSLGGTIDLNKIKDMDNVFLGRFCIRHRENNSKDKEGKAER